MDIALLGFGKMGKQIAACAEKNGDTIVAIIDPKEGVPLSLKAIEKADCCIDFSAPTSVLSNASVVAQAKKPLVIGTTGWEKDLASLKTLVADYQIGCLFSPNFSLGMAIFQKIVGHAAKLFESFPEYDRAGIEMHHNQKVDAPSGTALSLQQLAKLANPFSSVRCGSIPGTHTLLFDGVADTITLTHTARNRDGFAEGSLFAARWLIGKQGFFTLEDVL